LENVPWVQAQLWGSAQPSPGAIGGLALDGFRTVINLRGEHGTGYYRLEKEACEKNGIAFHSVQMRSRDIQRSKMVRKYHEILEVVEFPVLIHCKSGADRAGIAAAIYLLDHEGKDVEEAQKQLSLKYGHVRSASTGILDYFLERYAQIKAETGMSVLEWLESGYNFRGLKSEFKSQTMSNFLVDWILRRE